MGFLELTFESERSLSVACALGIVLLLASCRSAPDAPVFPVEAPDAFGAGANGGSAPLPERWWTSLRAPALSNKVEEALVGNFTLRSLWQRVVETRAIREREAAPLFPFLDGAVDGELRGTDGAHAESVELGLSAGYEVDLWGRIQATVEAEERRIEASIADYQAAALALSAEVALVYVRILESGAQQRLLDQQVQANEEILGLIRARLASQQLRGVDVLRQEQLIESTREMRIVEDERKQLLLHELAVLLGRVPGALASPPPAGLPPLPAPLDTGVPIDLIRRRPDIEAARQRVMAADRDIAAAVSEQYPRINLSASVSTAASEAEDIFLDFTRTFAAGLLAPLFDAGERAAEVDRTTAVRERLLADYGQTVLRAFREVEDALVRERQQRLRVGSLERQISLEENAYGRLQRDYLNGVGNYIDVLEALTDLQQLERDILEAKLLQLEARIALHLALSGGLDTPPLDPPLPRQRAAAASPEATTTPTTGPTDESAPSDETN